MPIIEFRAPIVMFLATAFCVVVLATGCQPSNISFVSDAGTYSSESVGKLFDTPVPDAVASAQSGNVADLRQQALTDLRRQGGEAERAAELLTSTFAASTAGVPYYVERATYEGEEVWLVLEARGFKDGAVSGRRLWVLDLDGDVVLSALR